MPLKKDSAEWARKLRGEATGESGDCDYFHAFDCVTRNIVAVSVYVTGNEAGMTDEKKTKTTADRQREFRERQRDAGFKQQTLWIHTTTREEGEKAARDGKPLKPMESKDPLSWAAGWISEKSKQ